MDEILLKKLLNESNNLSEITTKIFSNSNSNNREKVKRYLKDINIDYKEYFTTKKNNKKNFCLNCGKEIKGTDKSRKKFCNSSCAATYNNKLRGFHYCLNCGKKIKNKKFCNRKCSFEYKDKQLVKEWQNGNIKGYCSDGSIKQFVRRYLLNKFNNKCQNCGFNIKNQYTNLPILQIHHKDGNCYNCNEDNLELLCPNCHALTENFGSRNVNSTRIDRRTKYVKKN